MWINELRLERLRDSFCALCHNTEESALCTRGSHLAPSCLLFVLKDIVWHLGFCPRDCQEVTCTVCVLSRMQGCDHRTNVGVIYILRSDGLFSSENAESCCVTLREPRISPTRTGPFILLEACCKPKLTPHMSLDVRVSPPGSCCAISDFGTGTSAE